MPKIAQGSSPVIVTPIKPVANERVVAALRAALKDAKEGKAQAVGIAIAILDPDGDNGRSTETILSAADGWRHSLSCAVNGLAFRLNHERYYGGHVTSDPELDEGDE
jgi:hypothetical protein